MNAKEIQKRASSLWYAVSCDMGSQFDDNMWNASTTFEEWKRFIYSDEGRKPQDMDEEELYSVEELDLVFQYHGADLEKEFNKFIELVTLDQLEALLEDIQDESLKGLRRNLDNENSVIMHLEEMQNTLEAVVEQYNKLAKKYYLAEGYQLTLKVEKA